MTDHPPLRTLGLIGGMSWESTALYYRAINEAVRAARGGLASAPLLLHSLDFAPVAAMQAAGRWDEAGALLADSARRLEGAGAEAIVLCTNTMHRAAPAIEAAVRAPLLHLADATAAALDAAGHRRVGLLGTGFTMREAFYKDRLTAAGLDVLVPEGDDADEVHRVIYEELCRGRVLAPSRARYAAVVERLAARGAGAVVLGCTEIALLVGPADLCLPAFDTTAIHARAAADFALGGAAALRSAA